MSDLDEKEQNRVRTALRYLRRQCGGWKHVAKALGYSPETVTAVARGHDHVGATMAFRVARFVGVSVDDLIGGSYLPGACPRCGHMPDFGDEPTRVDDGPPPSTSGGALKLVK